MKLSDHQAAIRALVSFPMTEGKAKDVRRKFNRVNNPELFLRLLKFHRLSIHAERNLNQIADHGLPKSFRMQIARQAIYAQTFVRQQIDHLKKLYLLFGDAGLDLMPIKGPATSTRLYGEADRRELYDIDILIQPEQIKAVFDLMIANGYQLDKSFMTPPFTQDQLNRLMRWGSNVGFFHPETPEILIELHWRPGRYYHEFPVPTETIWSMASSINIDGLTMKTMNPEMEALFLSVHGFKHEWKRWHWLLDIATLLEQNQIDWQEVHMLNPQIAGSAQHRIIIKQAWHMSELIFQSTPPLLWDSNIGSNIKRNCASIIERRYTDNPKNDTPLSEARMEWRNAALTKTRAKFLRQHLSPGPDDWNWIKLPEALSALYYPLRLVRIIWALFTSPFRRR